MSISSGVLVGPDDFLVQLQCSHRHQQLRVQLLPFGRQPAPWQVAEVAPEAEPAPLNDVVAIAGRFGLDGRFLMAVRELRKRTLEELADEMPQLI